jgi:hypothetical protein
MVQSPNSNNTYYTIYPVYDYGPNFQTAQASIVPPTLNWYAPVPFTPATVRVDPQEKYLYIPSLDDGSLRRCSIQSNASNCTMMPLSSLVLPRALCLDGTKNELYYWDRAYQTIMKAPVGQNYPAEVAPVVSLQPPGLILYIL